MMEDPLMSMQLTCIKNFKVKLYHNIGKIQIEPNFINISQAKEYFTEDNILEYV